MLVSKAFGFDVTEGLNEKQSREILTALHWNCVADRESVLYRQRADGLLTQRTCCKRAFIRGAFMAAGSISDPNKSYHFEIVCHTMEQAEQLQKLIAGFEADAKIVERKKRFVLYLKEGSQIVDMLNVKEVVFIDENIFTIQRSLLVFCQQVFEFFASYVFLKFCRNH